MSIFDKFVHWWDYGVTGGRIMKTWRVVLLNGPDEIFKAERVESGGGWIRFLKGEMVVRRFKTGEVVGFGEEE